jgi:hypothetical protein
MRPVERIDSFLDKVKIRYLLKYIWKIHKGNENVIKKDIDRSIETIREYWKENSDLRFSQVLVNLGFISNTPGDWYYMEEPEILLKFDYNPAEVYYWGTCFDKDMNPLPQTIWRPIKELTTDHLRAIISGGFVERNPYYKKIMIEEVESRVGK